MLGRICMSFTMNINMPNFITTKRSNSRTSGSTPEAFVCKCKNCSTSADGTEFSNFSDLETHLKTQNMTFFNCPIYGCNHRLVAHSATITAHLLSKHQKVTENLKLTKESDKSAYYCNECNIYTDSVHFHCLECKASSKKLYFKSKEECSKHLKKFHNKWWLEHECKRGTSCPGFKSGKCGFNHLTHSDKFIMQDTSNSKVCRYEKPWDNMRCNREDCSFDHLWGRVRFILKLKNKKSKASKRDEGDEDEDDEDDANKSQEDDENKSVPEASGGCSDCSSSPPTCKELNIAFKNEESLSVCSSISSNSSTLISTSKISYFIPKITLS